MKIKNIKAILNEYYKDLDEQSVFDRDMDSYYNEKVSTQAIEPNKCPKHCYGYQIEACNICDIE